MPRKCREKQHMPRKSGNAANTFAAIQKRQCSENMPRLKTQKSGNAAKTFAAKPRNKNKKGQQMTVTVIREGYRRGGCT